MNNQINQYQQRLFYKLFATLPSINNIKEFNKESNFDFKIDTVYSFLKKDFWFARTENEDKFLFLFGVRNKPMKNVCGNDTCLIIDFDKNIQFNDNCLGLFSIKNSEIHILINWNLLKERYPNIDRGNFKINTFKSFDDSIDLNVFDLGNLDSDLIENLEKLIKDTSIIKSKKVSYSQKIKKNADNCEICSKKKSNFKIDSNLSNLSKLKPELCGKCIEKIVASEFYTKLTPLLQGNRTEELKKAKEKFGNDQLFDIGLKLLEKYSIIQYIGVKDLFFTIDNDSYLVKKFIKYSDKNNLLIDNVIEVNDLKYQMKQVLDEIKDGKDISQFDFNVRIELIRWIEKGKMGKSPYDVFYKEYNSLIEKEIEEYETTEINREIFLENYKSGKTKDESAKIADVDVSLINTWYLKGYKNKKPFVEFYNKYVEVEKNRVPIYPRVVKTDSFGNKNTISQMNIVLEDLVNGKSENEAISHANVSKDTYEYWINRGKQDFGEIYIQFYNYINEFKSKKEETSSIEDEPIENEISVDEGIYEPILEEYEKSFDSMNQSGIAWVDQSEDNWIYSRNINGKKIKLSADSLPELYEKVINQDLIWGIRDYDRAKKILDFPNDFEIPMMEFEDEINTVDLDVFAPLSDEYESHFNSMNQTGIAWVNKIGSKFYYVKYVNGKNIRLSGENVYELYSIVKKENQIWGIRDYDRAKQFIDIPDDFEIPEKPQVDGNSDDISIDVNPGIYAPLPDKYENSFNSMNQTGIAWVNKIGKRWIYTKRIDGKSFKIDDEDIYRLYEKVIQKNQIWGIRDYDRAKQFIDIPDDFEIPEKPQVDDSIDVEVDPDIFAPLPDKYESSFSSMNQTGIAWVNKVGNKWIYTKQVNGKSVRFDDEDIYGLYSKVILGNQIWGIRDYSKASKFIDPRDDFEIPKQQENEETEIVSDADKINESIYAPLSIDQLSKFNPNPNNKTGIAWVNKTGNIWTYKRQRNGKVVRFVDSNIIKLHEKVIKNNQIWGIIDIDKARKVIETNSVEDIEESKPPKPIKLIRTNDNVDVNYIEKPMNQFEILIKGVIKNRDLIDVLNRLDLFKENIKRIVTTSVNKQSDIFIELELNKYLLHAFEEKIEDLGWKLNK